MAVTAYDDACRFVELHPWATMESDNPVEILRELHAEHEALIDERNELQADLDEATAKLEEVSPHALTIATSQLDELLRFVRKLHDEQKICDVEWERARAMAKRIPAHLAEAK